METNNDVNVELNYEQIINRQLDRIAATSARKFENNFVKNEILEWELAILEAYIPDEILGEVQKIFDKKNGKEKKESQNRTHFLIKKLNEYINILAKKGMLFGKSLTSFAQKNKFEEWDK